MMTAFGKCSSHFQLLTSPPVLKSLIPMTWNPAQLCANENEKLIKKEQYLETQVRILMLMLNISQSGFDFVQDGFALSHDFMPVKKGKRKETFNQGKTHKITRQRKSIPCSTGASNRSGAAGVACMETSNLFTILRRKSVHLLTSRGRRRRHCGASQFVKAVVACGHKIANHTEKRSFGGVI